MKPYRRQPLTKALSFALLLAPACAPESGDDEGADSAYDDGSDAGLLEDKALVVTMQAEACTASSGCGKAASHAGYTGSGFMDFGGNGTWVEWNNVKVATAGQYKLKFRYANGSSRTRQAAILVNGVNATIVPFKGTGAWTTWANDEVEVALRAGNNTIRVLASTSSGGPNLDRMEVSRIVVRPKLPETISITVQNKGTSYQVELRRYSVRAPGFELYTFDDRRTQQQQLQEDVPEPRTYRGYVANDKTLVATGFIDAEGQLGLSLFGGQGIVLRLNDVPLNGDYSVSSSGYATYDNIELRDSSITTPEISSNRLYVPAPGPNFHSYLSRVRAHYYSPTFQRAQADGGAGGDLAIGLMDIEGTLNDFDYAFGRYVGLRHDLAWVQIDLHGNDQAYSTDWPGYNEQGLVPTNHSYNFRAWGGRAGASAGGSKAAGYPGRGRAEDMWWHEIGHLLTFSHYNPSETHRGVMRNGTQLDLMQSQMALKYLQTNAKWFTAKPFDPRTSPMLPAPSVDYITVYKGQSGTVRPLDNDFDANGEKLSLAAFDATTQNGGSVTLESDGTLRYTPKPDFVGTDYFTYTAQDTAGYSAKQTIHVMAHPKGLAGDWPIDDDTRTVTDRSGYGRDLFLAQGNLTDWMIPGSQGQSLETVVSAASELVADPLGNMTLPHDFDPGHLSFSASIWFKYSPTGTQRHVIVGKGAIPNYDIRMGGWEIVAKGHDLAMNVAYRDRLAAENLVQIQWPGAIQDGRWHHAVLVIDREGGLLRGYLDGQAHAEPAALLPTGGPIGAGYSHLDRAKGGSMTVGRHTQDPTGGGAWDCLKIYHVALTAGQISSETCPVK